MLILGPPQHMSKTTDRRGGLDGSPRVVVVDDAEIDEGGTVGWMVDEVFQVRDVSPEDVDQGTTVEDEGVRGIVKSDDRFVVWVSPDVDDALAADLDDVDSAEA